MTAADQRPYHLIVTGLSRSSTRGRLMIGHMHIPCALGKSGQRARKREGDGGTPLGRLGLLMVLYRADRVARPRTGLPVRLPLP